MRSLTDVILDHLNDHDKLDEYLIPQHIVPLLCDHIKEVGKPAFRKECRRVMKALQKYRPPEPPKKALFKDVEKALKAFLTKYAPPKKK